MRNINTREYNSVVAILRQQGIKISQRYMVRGTHHPNIVVAKPARNMADIYIDINNGKTFASLRECTDFRYGKTQEAPAPKPAIPQVEAAKEEITQRVTMNLSDLTTKKAIAAVMAEDNADLLFAAVAEEEAGRNRKTVLAAIKSRTEELAG